MDNALRNVIRFVSLGGHMKRLALPGAVLTMLVLAGIAVAHGNDSQMVTKVTASFTATNVSGKTDTKTCTTTDGKSLSTTRSTWIAAGPRTRPSSSGA